MMAEITQDDFKEYFLDIDQWDPDAIASYRQVIESSLSEVHDRERQLLNRSGALLSMNGVILSLIARFGIDTGIPMNSLILAQVSIVFIVISSCIIGWVIIPPYRTVISSTSGVNEYSAYCKDSFLIEKAILLEKIQIYNETMNKNSFCSTILSIGLILLTMGFISLGLSLVVLNCESYLISYVYILFISIIVVTLVAMFHRVYTKG